MFRTLEWERSSPNAQPMKGNSIPALFYSRRLSPAERNYDMGNCELLAVKLPLKEWRHCLEGSRQLFLVWTNHKNLTYLQDAKRLNSPQAHWSLFFARFNFSITYHPGSHNVKPDALCRQFSADNETFCHLPATLEAIPGKLRTRSSRPCSLKPTLVWVHLTVNMFPQLFRCSPLDTYRFTCRDSPATQVSIEPFLFLNAISGELQQTATRECMLWSVLLAHIIRVAVDPFWAIATFRNPW